MNVAIYVVTHKKRVNISSKLYVPIQVGKVHSNINLGYLRDDLGDENISSKNKTFCELTALYWIWKYDKKNNYIGFCHYRRFFSNFRGISHKKCLLKETKLLKILENYDIILPKKYVWKDRTVAEKYYIGGKGLKKDLDIVRDVISDYYPNYAVSFDAVLNNKSASYCNMFIMNRKLLNEYCNWLFTILFEVEERIDISQYSPEEARVFGYLGEILLNVWAEGKSLRIFECTMINTELYFKDLLIKYVRNKLRNLKNK